MQRLCALLILFLLATVYAEAQQPMIDVVYLHNGSIIRGMVIEQIPDESLKIETRDGSVFVYEMSEIQRIVREPLLSAPQWYGEPTQQGTSTPQQQRPEKEGVRSEPAMQPAPGTSRKEPSTATFLGFLITGAGHMYAGESGTGLLLLVVGASAPFIGAALSSCDYDTYSYSCNTTPLYIGIGVSAFTWLYSVADAGKAARRTNQENGWEGRRTAFAPTVLRDPVTGDLHAGLAMRLNF